MEKPKEALVGTIFILALVVLAGFTVVIGRITPPWVVKHYLRVEFGDVSGLKRGDEVRVQGLQIGKVSYLAPPDERGLIVVTLELKKPVTVYRDYRIEVRGVSPLGGRFVSITPGSVRVPEVKLTEQTVLQGFSVGDPLAELSLLLAKIGRGEGALPDLLNKSDLSNDIRSTVRSAKAIVADLEAGKGTLGKLLRDEKLADSLTATADSLQAITRSVQEGKGTLGRLATDDRLYKDAADVMATLKAVTADIKAGRGTLGKLSKDEQLYANAVSAMASFASMGERIATGKGLIGRLISDEAFYNEVRDTVLSLKNALGSVEAGGGTLGKLLQDDALYKKIDQLLGNVNDVVEDFRDQAPIGLFANLLMMGL